MPAAIELTAVTVVARHRSSGVERALLQDIEWRVEPGEHWALLGPNGAGKTTLLHVAAGTVRSSAGRVRVLGERQRILLARTLMRDPEILLLDEPTTGLDLAGRERLLQALARLVGERPRLATVTVTHHVEELAPTTTHVLLLRDGVAVATGPVAETLTGPLLWECASAPP